MSRFPRPVLHAPFCSPEGFDRAFEVLEGCVIGQENLPVGGFTRPFAAPGGLYGAGWWSLDSSLAAEGFKWVDPAFAADIVYNLAAVQRPDGRVPFWYMDAPEKAVYNVHEEIGGIPKFFEVCYHLVQRSADDDLCRTAYTLISRNIDWWFARRLDTATGLMTAVFEETFIPNTLTGSGEFAPVDTNMELIVGCHVAAELADRLGLSEEAALLRGRKAALQESVRRYLWDDRQRTFASLWVRTGLHEPVSTATAFMAMRYDTATPAQKATLLQWLDDEAAYSPSGYSLPSVSRCDPRFTVVRGPYIGNPSWSGSVWTLINQSVIRALREAGQETRAARLALRTAEEFADNYYEFLDPTDGSGHGVVDYAWTAAQYIQIIVEEIFGVRYDGVTGALTLDPLPVAGEMTLEGLTLPDGRVVTVTLKDGKAQAKFS